MDILKKDIRQTIVSGLFYPEESQILTNTLNSLLKDRKTGTAAVILYPHGSWKHTGPSIAAAFAGTADRTIETVLLLAGVHREEKETAIALPSAKYFDSPLGLLKVDQNLRSRLLESGEPGELFQIDDCPHMEEHSLELALPFVKHLFPNACILPMLTGALNRKQIKQAAAAIRRNIKNPENTLFAISGNLSRLGLKEESLAEAESLAKNLELPLKESLLEKKKAGIISSCATVPLTILSDIISAMGISLMPGILEKNSCHFREKEMEKAIVRAGICWIRQAVT